MGCDVRLELFVGMSHELFFLDVGYFISYLSEPFTLQFAKFD